MHRQHAWTVKFVECTDSCMLIGFRTWTRSSNDFQAREGVISRTSRRTNVVLRWLRKPRQFKWIIAIRIRQRRYTKRDTYRVYSIFLPYIHPLSPIDKIIVDCRSNSKLFFLPHIRKSTTNSGVEGLNEDRVAKVEGDVKMEGWMRFEDRGSKNDTRGLESIVLQENLHGGLAAL